MEENRFKFYGAAQYRASRRYEEKNIRRIVVKLNRKTDQDIIDRLDSVDNIQGYIKQLIRNDK